MIFEKLSCMTVDVDRLRQHFNDHVNPLPPMMQGPAFGGWSIQSYSGSYKDGWQMGHTCFEKDPVTGKAVFNWDKARAIGLYPPRQQVNPTEVNHGYVAEVMNQIIDLGFTPCRARFSVLRARSESSLHRDGPDGTYMVRLHIPVITNELCKFHSEGESEYAPADGSVYLVAVNRMHQIFNGSYQDRIHIIMDVWDHKGHSEHHKYDPAVPNYDNATH